MGESTEVPVEQHARLQALVESVGAPVFSLDREYRYTAFNSVHAAVMKALYGADVQLGHSLAEYQSSPDDWRIAKANLDRALQGETLHESEYSGNGAARRYFEVDHYPIRTEGGEVIGVTVLAREVTARTRAEMRVSHLNRVLLAIRSVHELIIRERDPEKLLRQACAVLVDTRGYSGAWIALAPKGAGETATVVGAGIPDGQFAEFASSLSREAWPPCCAWARDSPSGLAVINKAGGCGACCFGQGCPGTAVAILRSGPAVLGYVGVALSQDEPFDEDERTLFREVAGDLAFALDAIDRDELRRQSDERFRASFEDAAIGMALASRDGRFLRVNRAFARMLGYETQELEGLHFSEVTQEDDLETGARAMEALVAGGPPQRFEKRYRHRDGSAVWADVNVAAANDVAGSPQFFIASLVDITARKRMEENLRDSELRYRSLFENMRNGLAYCRMIFAPDGTPNDFVYLDVNRAFEAQTGLRNVAGRLVSELIPGIRESDPGLFERYGRVALTGVPESFETFVASMQMWFSVSVYSPKKGFFVAVFDVITERKRAEAMREHLEEQLRAAQKMEAIGRLAGGVAHDFNNLMAVILSYVGFLADGMHEQDPKRADVLEVKEAASRAVALTRQLLAFSRKQVLQPIPLDLNRTARGVEKMLRRILGEDIELVQVLAPDLGLTLADPGQIEQVIMNLAVNARDAMPDGGKLTLATSNVEIDQADASHRLAVQPGSYVQLVFTDTGSGMDEETKARVFDPFFTTKPTGVGTGLGLSTVYGIVKQSGGDVWVDSQVGKGSTFTIRLPRASADASPELIVPPKSRRRETGSETILVVEDEDALRVVAKRSLEAAGYTVLAAARGDEALAMCAERAGEIHLLLTDVVMPRMNGRALAQEVMKTRPGLKVLYMSGYTDDAIVHHGVLEAGTHLLSKPFTGADVTRKVREVLDRETS